MNDSFGLIIDGFTLSLIANSSSRLNLLNEFRDLAIKCDAVLCCRVLPAQKALVCLNISYLFNIWIRLNYSILKLVFVVICWLMFISTLNVVIMPG